MGASRGVPHTTTARAGVFVVLAAGHGARPGPLRALGLGDLDRGTRRIRVAGDERWLDGLTRQMITGWLNYRRRCWPSTANLHLIITMATAIGVGAVCASVLAAVLRGLPATIERLGIDRYLDDAQASGGDPPAVAEVFTISDNAAIRDATTALALLASPHAASVSSPATPGPIRLDRAEKSSGSR